MSEAESPDKQVDAAVDEQLDKLVKKELDTAIKSLKKRLDSVKHEKDPLPRNKRKKPQ